MRFSDRHGVEIASLEDWARLGKPASTDHWKRGRSAYELAADWIEQDACDAVAALLSLRPEFSGLQLLEGIAEKQTRFDQDTHGPRNHDLLVRAVVGDVPVAIGVEGKADEPFDDPLWLYREKGLRRSANTGALARVDRLVRLWFKTSLRQDDAEPSLVCLGYQLFSALAGTLADAQLDGSAFAIVLVMEYRTDCTVDSKHAANARSLERFLARLIGPDVERNVSPAGWVTKPCPVRGDGKWMPPRTNVSFAKLTRDRRYQQAPLESASSDATLRASSAPSERSG
jgi:hypothetical protein